MAGSSPDFTATCVEDRPAVTIRDRREPPLRPERASPPRRVLIVHNRYQIRGGEDVAVEREVAALIRAGVMVETVFVDNDVIRSPLDRVRAAVEVAHAPRGVAIVLDAVRRFRPDVVHMHNTFPLISPAVHGAVRALGPATVQTMHNFRVACANGLLMRQGAPCEDCVTGSPYNAVRHGCYRDSRVGSLAVAHMIDTHRRAGTWTTQVDRFIALTDFARSCLVRAGLPAARIRVKPTGLPDPGPGPGVPRSGLLYVGRLSVEKGVLPLADAARLATLARLAAIGEGPLHARMTGIERLTMLGVRDRAGVNDAMARTTALVVPSVCYEGLPMAIVEAFAAGTPVIASKIGGLAEVVEHGVTGLHVRPGDAADLASACDWMAAHPGEAARMGRAARASFERNWTEDVTTRSLVSIYAEAAAARMKEAS